MDINKYHINIYNIIRIGMGLNNMYLNHTYMHVNKYTNQQVSLLYYIYDDDDDIKFISTKIGSCTPSLVREENNNKIIVIR